MNGVVKSVDATKLVISRPRKAPSELTFALSPSTLREGPIGVGAKVQVRFRITGPTHVATAVLAISPELPAEREAP